MATPGELTLFSTIYDVGSAIVEDRVFNHKGIKKSASDSIPDDTQNRILCVLCSISKELKTANNLAFTASTVKLIDIGVAKSTTSILSKSGINTVGDVARLNNLRKKVVYVKGMNKARASDVKFSLEKLGFVIPLF